jgi:hypothetical protein
MAQRMNNSYLMIRQEHQTRMKNVMTEIRALKDSMTSSAEYNTNSQEMQQLRFQVAQYENVLPVYQSRIKDTEAEDLNKRLWKEKHEFTRSIENLKDRLNKAELLVFNMGTPEAIRRRGTSRRQADKEERTEQSSSSSSDDEQEQSSSFSSEDDHGGAGSQQRAEQNAEIFIDLSVSPTDPVETIEGAVAAPAVKLSFREVLDSSSKHASSDVTMDGSTGTEAPLAHQRLISLTPLIQF